MSSLFGMPVQPTDPILTDLMARARAAWEALTPEQRAEEIRRQRRSYVIAEMGMGSDQDEFDYRAALASEDHDTIKRLDAEGVARMERAEQSLKESGLW